jgi:5-methyltetrahydrofolate--homocysteine methyltransferase
MNNFHQLEKLLEERIVFLDGAMGTMVQGYELAEEDYRGTRFADSAIELKGNHDLLTITRPDVIEEIHRSFFAAGADVIETNTFNSSEPALADYGLEACVAELNLAAAKLARSVADAVSKESGVTRFVAGALGPTNRTASIRCQRSWISQYFVRRTRGHVYGSESCVARRQRGLPVG